MPSLNGQIRIAMADVIRSVLSDINVYPYPHFGTSVPRITVAASQQGYIEYQLAFDSIGIAMIRFEVWVECVAADDVSPQMVLDGYLSPDPGDPGSVPGALNTDRTLGGLVDDVRCVTARVLQITPDGPQVAVIDVEVLLSERT